MSGPLFLRSLNLLGFKTFARATEIRFEGGLTAIVGPNGSGKTNIVDSIKWVLGEGQARDLRGKKMEDVIYAGGERRSRAAFAEVSVVFDNTAGRLPVDYHEVAITRRVERDGDSDYFLNGSRVRRRDLLHLLSSTGLTVDSYAIIDQRDIEHIVVCTPAERRQLLEEAAQVRGVKQRRQEAAQRLAELAQNLLRLEDLKSEIEPRLEQLRDQAAAAREAAEAAQRLEVLRGSIVWEEWREARDAHRHASSQAQSLERKLIDAREQAGIAESEFQEWRTQMQAAQDRRLIRQKRLGELRLASSDAAHALQLAEARVQSRQTLVDGLRQEAGTHVAREAAAEALQHQLVVELEQAKAGLEAVQSAPPVPPMPDPAPVQGARRAAEHARRELASGAAALASLRARREFLDEQVARTAPLAAAAERIPEAESEASAKRVGAADAQKAALELARLTAELAGLDAIHVEAAGMPRLRDVITAEPGYELALSAALGPLADAFVAADSSHAAEMAAAADVQATILYPYASAQEEAGSLMEHVHTDLHHGLIARTLLGRIVVGRDVTLDGVYRAPGLVRAGRDARAEVGARRTALKERIAFLSPAAAIADEAEEQSRNAEKRLADLRAGAVEAARIGETRRLLDSARAAEQASLQQLPELEQAAIAADETAARLESELEAGAEAYRTHRSEAQSIEAERVRWRDRIEDLGRQLHTVRQDVIAMRHAAEDRAHRLQQAQASLVAAEESLPSLSAAIDTARDALADVEAESPEEEAELAEGARKLITLEEARIDARLKTSTLEGNHELINREAELLAAKMDEIRARMPDGVAPEEIPGGKSREKEMRSLERRLEEIGPVNALAESECRELEERYTNLHAQLEDITAARADLETLIAKLREEEETRYEAVFGAVAANFHEYFSQLAPGGRATLRHAEGDDGPRTGVEILVQPPKKRLQNVTLLSSGERSLAALALVLALDEVNPSPFTVLDEVDAALDDANVGRFGEMLSRLSRERQFLVITHNHVTMSFASTLYGIHLDESGTSHIVSVRLEDVRKPMARKNPATRAG